MSCFANIAMPVHEWHVRAEFLHDGDPARRGTFRLGRAHRVVAEPGHCLRFMVLLDDGARFHGLPIHALCWKPCDPLPLETLSMWNAMSYHASVYRDPLIGGLDVQVKLGDGSIAKGEHLFCVDYVHAEPQLTDGGLSSFPAEKKEHVVCALESGHLAAMPGNRCVFIDASYMDNPIDFARDTGKLYSTNTRTFSCEGARASRAGEWR